MVTNMMCLNYRPVSFFISFSKFLESVMQSGILRHLTKYNILSTAQYGLRTKLKRDNAAYKLTTEILSAVHIKLLVGVIFCDLKKAFDCVDHNILSAKLKFCGISVRDYALFKSYLENRYQQHYIMIKRHAIKSQVGLKYYVVSHKVLF